MQEQPVLKHIEAKQASVICAGYKLRPELAPLLEDDPTPLRFLDRLLAKEDYQLAAVDFMAHALPKRLAIWWGCVCIWLHRKELKPAEIAAVTAVVQWVHDPSEEHRRAAQAVGEAASLTAPAGLLAQAVFQSGGSLLPPNLPVVPPGPTMTADGVRNAVHLTAVAAPADEVLAAYRRCIALGIGVAMAK